MAFKRDLLEDWIRLSFPGETLVAYTVATAAGGSEEGSRHATSGVDGDRERDELRLQLGLADAAKVVAGESTTFLAVTQTQLVVGSRSSVRNRPKDLVVAAPLTDVGVHWFDAGGGPNSFRHWVIDLGGGSWRTDRTGLKALGRETKTATAADEFVAALGDRAVQH